MAATIIIITVLAVAVIIGVRSARKRFSSEGSCCASGGEAIIAEEKKLNSKKIGEKRIHIEGMTCENCQKRIERQLNRIDGVVAHVDWKQKRAEVELEKEVSDEEMTRVIERLDYRVTGIESVD